MSRHSAAGAAWQAQRLRVLERDDWTCAYCRKELTGSDATVDHVSPIAHSDGADYSDNALVAACRTCNGRKQDKTAFRIEYRNERWT